MKLLKVQHSSKVLLLIVFFTSCGRLNKERLIDANAFCVEHNNTILSLYDSFEKFSYENNNRDIAYAYYTNKSNYCFWTLTSDGIKNNLNVEKHDPSVNTMDALEILSVRYYSETSMLRVLFKRFPRINDCYYANFYADSLEQSFVDDSCFKFVLKR